MSSVGWNVAKMTMGTQRYLRVAVWALTGIVVCHRTPLAGGLLDSRASLQSTQPLRMGNPSPKVVIAFRDMYSKAYVVWYLQH